MVDETFDLRLYVAGQTPKAVRAFANLRKICDEHLAGRYASKSSTCSRIRSSGRGDQILALPTLVRRLPSPIKKIIGDLSNTERVLVGLDLRQRQKGYMIKRTTEAIAGDLAAAADGRRRALRPPALRDRDDAALNPCRAERARRSARSTAGPLRPGGHRYLSATDARASGEQIIAAPTLVKKSPSPLRYIIGDLSSTERVLRGLDLGCRRSARQRASRRKFLPAPRKRAPFAARRSRGNAARHPSR